MLFPKPTGWIFFTLSWQMLQGADYEFTPDDDQIFTACPDKPGTNGILDIVDISEIILEYNDGVVRVEGNMTFIWKDVKPTDRMEVIGEMLKFQRGSWQPTILTMRLRDFCRVQYDPLAPWYAVWSVNVPENERKCINNVGHTIHYRPYNVNTTVKYFINLEGRHKIVVNIYAYDENGRKRPKSYCFEVIGVFAKVR
ncbi:uncharacterized protein LOC131804583 [Musca domestica]|uniref:Uncharacterized protein LOC101896845 n=2 Tax=Musca domestica TaxID=7370 RepID=A0A9J7I6K3_MUSDO|nr:uncharacterized protein LOC101896845 [Musca domestica]XP_058983618.1 uncharacterized protein LOC131804583 [Musca domestica]